MHKFDLLQAKSTLYNVIIEKKWLIISNKVSDNYQRHKLRFAMKTSLVYSCFFCVVLLFTIPEFTRAQNSDPVIVRIETRDGSTIQGEVISETDDYVVIRTASSGDITIQRANITNVKVLNARQFRNGEYWHDNPQSTRYFFVPNAMGLPKGQGYYQNIWILFNNVNYGVTDNFSMGVGFIPMFLFGVSETPIWLLPKVSFPVISDEFHVAAGAMIGGVVGVAGFGAIYGMTTYGNRDNNISLGLGYGYAGSEVSDSPVVTVSGMYRFSKRWYFVTDNYFFPSATDNGLLNFGVRWAPERVAVDFSLTRLLTDNEDADYVGFPLLGVTIPFGK
jgi:hypothetical protein